MTSANPGFMQNLRDLPSSFALSTWTSGLVVELVAYSGPVVIVLQAAHNAGLDQGQIASWLWSLTVACGLLAIFMCLWYRLPVVLAWSTPGAALLVTSLGQYPFPAVVGAYLVAGLAMTLLGFSGLFGRVMKLVPTPVIMGMLGGVLLQFGIGLFNALPERTLMVIAMIVTFFVLRRFAFRTPTIGALVVGLLIAFLGQDLHLSGVTLTLTVPQFTAPQFTPEAILGLGLPLFLLALTGQNAPGMAVMRASGYELPVDGALVMTGIVSTLTSVFGGSGINLAAITAAIVTNPESQPDPDRRYAAGVSTGVWKIIFGLFAATTISLFSALPSALVAAVSGLALMGVLISSISGAMADPYGREGGMVALLCTAGNFTLFGIGAPFWGLVFGLLVHFIMRYSKIVIGAPAPVSQSVSGEQTSESPEVKKAAP